MTDPKSTKIETHYDSIDWTNLAATVQTKLTYLRAAWQASERDLPPELHTKMVEDLYLPVIVLLAQFCDCIEETPDGTPPDPKLMVPPLALLTGDG